MSMAMTSDEAKTTQDFNVQFEVRPSSRIAGRFPRLIESVTCTTTCILGSPPVARPILTKALSLTTRAIPEYREADWKV